MQNGDRGMNILCCIKLTPSPSRESVLFSKSPFEYLLHRYTDSWPWGLSGACVMSPEFNPYSKDSLSLRNIEESFVFKMINIFITVYLL
jgi:hypothetical protein